MRLTHSRTAIRYYIGALAMIEHIELFEHDDEDGAEG